MELITYILYVLASKTFLLLIFSIFLVIGGFSFVSVVVAAAIKSRPPQGESRSLSGAILRFVVPMILIGAFAVVLGVLVLSIVNLARPHLVDGMLINAIGQKADAKVLRVEPTNNQLNEQTVMRHDVIFRTATGENVETYFETWDFNVYPSANSVSYPEKGESFRVAYLPSYPTAFLILTDEDSGYSRSRECARIISELEAAKIKVEVDPGDKNYKRELDEATKKLISGKCGTTTGESNRTYRESSLQ